MLTAFAITYSNLSRPAITNTKNSSNMILDRLNINKLYVNNNLTKVNQLFCVFNYNSTNSTFTMYQNNGFSSWSVNTSSKIFTFNFDSTKFTFDSSDTYNYFNYSINITGTYGSGSGTNPFDIYNALIINRTTSSIDFGLTTPNNPSVFIFSNVTTVRNWCQITITF